MHNREKTYVKPASWLEIKVASIRNAILRPFAKAVVDEMERRQKPMDITVSYGDGMMFMKQLEHRKRVKIN